MQTCYTEPYLFLAELKIFSFVEKDRGYKMKKIAVLVPCYNEELTIANVIEDFHQHLPEADIYVYDNNSSDKTAQGAIVVPEYQQGKGNVVRSMFRDIDADCYIMVDGDDTYPAEDAVKVAQLVLDGKAEMAIGDRLSSTYFTENKRPFHNLGNRMVRGLINFIFNSNVKDIMTGCRAFSRRFVKSFPVLSAGFEIETEMTVHALDKNLAIREIPISYRDRMEGSVSKLNTFSDGFKVLITIFRLFREYKPLQFFGLFALILALFAAVLFLPVLIYYFRTGLVPRFPTLIVSCFSAVCALLSFSCGLILDSIRVKHRQLFELYLHLQEKGKKDEG